MHQPCVADLCLNSSTVRIQALPKAALEGPQVAAWWLGWTLSSSTYPGPCTEPPIKSLSFLSMNWKAQQERKEWTNNWQCFNWDWPVTVAKSPGSLVTEKVALWPQIPQGGLSRAREAFGQDLGSLWPPLHHLSPTLPALLTLNWHFSWWRMNYQHKYWPHETNTLTYSVIAVQPQDCSENMCCRLTSSVRILLPLCLVNLLRPGDKSYLYWV